EHAPVVREEHLVVELVESAKANPGPEVVGRTERANGRIEYRAAHDPFPTPERIARDGEPPADRLGHGDARFERAEARALVVEEARQCDRRPLVPAAPLPDLRVCGEPDPTEIPLVARHSLASHPARLDAELERHRPLGIDVRRRSPHLRTRLLVA